jgi:hypothetical protein
MTSTTGKNENKITVTLSRDEINACSRLICFGSIPPKYTRKSCGGFYK